MGTGQLQTPIRWNAQTTSVVLERAMSAYHASLDGIIQAITKSSMGRDTRQESLGLLQQLKDELDTVVGHAFAASEAGNTWAPAPHNHIWASTDKQAVLAAGQLAHTMLLFRSNLQSVVQNVTDERRLGRRSRPEVLRQLRQLKDEIYVVVEHAFVAREAGNIWALNPYANRLRAIAPLDGSEEIKYLELPHGIYVVLRDGLKLWRINQVLALGEAGLLPWLRGNLEILKEHLGRHGLALTH